jgi:hypothetical protein
MEKLKILCVYNYYQQGGGEDTVFESEIDPSDPDDLYFKRASSLLF